jgi:hypothetical protein
MAYNLSDLRVQLLRAGYHIIPNRAKIPIVKGWNTPEFIAREFTDDGKGTVAEKLERWPKRWPASQTIGVRLDNRLVVIDADIDDVLVDSVMAEIDSIAPDVYRLAPMRFGAGPHKRALFCRLADGEEPFRRLGSHKYGEVGHCVEVFGGGRLKDDRCSRQFGIYGVHSYNDDGTVAAEYSWDAAGSALHEVAIGELPAITRAQCAAIVDAFDAHAKAVGWPQQTRFAEPASSAQRIYDIDEELTRFDVRNCDEPLAYADLEEGMRCSSSFWDALPHNNKTKCHVGWSPRHDCICVHDYETEATHYPKQLSPEPPPPEGVVTPDWPDRGLRGKPKSSYLNCILALQALHVRCRLNRFITVYEVEVAGAGAVELSDALVRELRVLIQLAFHFEADAMDVNEAVRRIGEENGYDPLVDMLAAAQASWDGVARVDRIAVDVFNADDTPLNRVFVRKWMIAAVRRARSPGCKFDNMLVLEAPEAYGKSTSLAILGGEYYSDVHTLGLEEKATRELMAGVWIHENAELAGMNRKDENAQKASLSKTVDRSRGAYERNATSAPRRYVEAGTTNDETYLQSITGNRRYWPIRMLARVDRETLRAVRFQLLGEAAAIEASGESLELDDDMTALAREAQDERRAQDPWEDKLAQLQPSPNGGAGEPYSAYCIQVRGDYETVTTSAITDYLLGRSWTRADTWHGKKVNAIMLRLGWERHKLGSMNDRVWGYRRLRSGPHRTTIVDFTGREKP